MNGIGRSPVHGSAASRIGARFETLVAVWALIGGAVLLAMVLVTAANVSAFTLDRLARLGGSTVSGLTGYEDFVRLAISVVGLMFFPYCQLRHGHVSVDLFARGLPCAAQRALDGFWLLCTAVIAGFLAWYMVGGMVEARQDRTVSPVLGWPEWPFYAPGIVSLALWGLVAAHQIFGVRRDG
jgi:TRAP-type C4-dicarboxylate transport system permease small subunit